MEGYKDFHELSIWKQGYNLLMIVYKIAGEFPDWEKFSLGAQVTRSSCSVIANIAEAHGRYSFNDKVRVLYIVRGELFETRSHLSVAFGRKYINGEIFKSLNNGYVDLGRELNKYIKSLKV